MKVLLSENVKGLGEKLKVVNVSEGYAKNYLFPKGLAKELNKTSISYVQSQISSKEYKHSQEVKAAEKIKKILEENEISFVIKMGKGNKAFGSITQKEIKEEILKKCKIEIDKKKIELEEPIKTEGVHVVKIKLYEKIFATQKVVVKGE